MRSLFVCLQFGKSRVLLCSFIIISSALLTRKRLVGRAGMSAGGWWMKKKMLKRVGCCGISQKTLRFQHEMSIWSLKIVYMCMWICLVQSDFYHRPTQCSLISGSCEISAATNNNKKSLYYFDNSPRPRHAYTKHKKRLENLSHVIIIILLEFPVASTVGKRERWSSNLIAKNSTKISNSHKNSFRLIKKASEKR